MLKVDHTAPSISLTGSMISQYLYPRRPSYTLKVKGTDGTEASPQSGVSKVDIAVDGTTVDSTAPGCPTQNCSVTREWTLNSADYSSGKHVVRVTTTDGAGLVTEKTLDLDIQRDTTAPTISSTTGGLENAPSGWVEQKSYKLGVSA